MLLFPLLTLILFLSDNHFISCFLHEIPLTKQPLTSNSISTSINPSLFYTLPISIGTPSQPFNVIIATGSSGLLIADISSNLNTTNKYDASKSTTSNNTQQTQFFPFFDLSLSYGNLYNDTFNITSNFTIDSFQFASLIYSTFNPSTINDGILGMNQNDTNAISLLGQKIFSLYDPETTNGESFMYIGDKHSNFTNNSNTIAQCEVTENKELYWKCKASHIILNDTITSDILSNRSYSFEFEEEIIFDSGSNAFMFPHKYEKQFINILNKQCKVETANENIEYITCKKDYIKDIHIVINEYALKIKKENIWEEIKDKEGNVVYGLNVFFNKKEATVIIGMQMFKGYHVLFNKEDKEIQFYTHNEGFIVKINNINITLIVLLSVGGLIIIVSEIVLLYHFLCKKKSKYELEDKVNDLGTNDQQLIANQE